MTTQAHFGQNTQPDPQTVPGWTVQSNVGQQQGYAQPGLTASADALTSTGNGTPGAPNPVPGDATSILANAGYGDADPALVTVGTELPAGIVPVPASGEPFTNPVGLNCQLTIAGGAVTGVEVNGVEVGSGPGTYTVPAGASVTMTYTSAPTWAWTTV